MAGGELAPLAKVKFPTIPGVAFPAIVHLAYPSNYGPEFRTKGIVTQEPPELGKPYPLLFPQVDGDGNDIAGIRMPEIQVPLGTYTGWNLRTPDIGAPDELNSMQGSFIPFPRTRADRDLRHDPRLSIQERYPGRAREIRRSQAVGRRALSRPQRVSGEIRASR